MAIPDMPFHLVALHPRAMKLSLSAYGMLCSLTTHYWISGTIPQNDAEVCALANASLSLWRAHRTKIKAILADVMPQLAQARVKLN
jgi:uncharacterized protein YdaU (DUF1376 family)